MVVGIAKLAYAGKGCTCQTAQLLQWHVPIQMAKLWVRAVWVVTAVAVGLSRPPAAKLFMLVTGGVLMTIMTTVTLVPV